MTNKSVQNDCECTSWCNIHRKPGPTPDSSVCLVDVVGCLFQRESDVGEFHQHQNIWHRTLMSADGEGMQVACEEGSKRIRQAAVQCKRFKARYTNDGRTIPRYSSDGRRMPAASTPQLIRQDDRDCRRADNQDSRERWERLSSRGAHRRVWLAWCAMASSVTASSL